MVITKQVFANKLPPHFNASLDLGDQIVTGKYVLAPQVDHITKSGNVTVVHWTDKTKTTVTRSAEDIDNDYAAFCAAVAKKMFRSTFNVCNIVETKNDEYINAKKEREKQARVAAQAELEKRNHDRAVRRIAKRMKIENEAKMLYNKMMSDVEVEA